MRTMLFALVTGAAFAATLGTSPLADAAGRNDGAAVRALLAQKADVNTPQVDGTTALHWAAHFDDADLLKALLAAGASAKTANRYGITPLSEACQNGNEQVVAMLLKAGADPNQPTTEGETPLMTAARTGNPAAIRVLLDSGAQINTAEQWRGQTALMWAAAEGHTDAVRLLISKGAFLDAKSKVFDLTALRPKAGSVGMNFPRGGFTPLLFAARQGNSDVVKVLLDAGANINLPDPDGTTPLLIAIINFHYDIAAYLIDKGADVNASDGHGRTPLYGAIDQKNLDISNRPPAKVEDKNTPLSLINLLLAKGASPNATLLKSIQARAVLDGADGVMAAGATPFLRAARAGDVETMKMLLDHKADLNATTSAGVNAMLIAAGTGWRDGKTNAPDADSIAAIRFLAAKGLSINVASPSGETPLHAAAGRGSDPVVEALVAMGADVNAQDKTNRTPLDVAAGVGGGLLTVRSPQESTMALLTKLGGKPGPPPDKAATIAAPLPANQDPVQNPSVVIKRPIIVAEPKPAGPNQ